MVQGTFSNNQRSIVGFVSGNSVAAVTGSQWLVQWGGSSMALKIGGIQAYARTAGTGVGNTVLDIFVNGVSIWNRSGDRPTLAATSTGAFVLQAPVNLTVQIGDRIDIQVASISSSGHAQLSALLTLEAPS
jgi:hypothetical protein